MEACFCECSSQEITGWIWTSRWSVVWEAEFTSAPPKHSVVSLGKYTPFVDYDSLIKWKRQCWNSETSPNSDNSQIHRCSTRTKINFSDYMEVDRTGFRKPEGVEWPSGEISQCPPKHRNGPRWNQVAYWWLILSIHFRIYTKVAWLWFVMGSGGLFPSSNSIDLKTFKSVSFLSAFLIASKSLPSLEREGWNNTCFKRIV